MGKKILDSKALYMVLSIAIAVSLWFYVVSLDGNQDEKSIQNIPITFVGLDILEERGLMVVGDPPTVSLRVRAGINTLARLERDTITLTVNVANISVPNEYTMGYSYNFNTTDTVELVSSSSNNVTFEVARYTTREVDIQGVFTGSAAEGYLAGDNEDFVFSPGALTVSGQADQVNQIAYARVTLGDEELTETVSREQPYQLIGTTGEVLTELDVTCETETIYTTFPILATAEIPLEVELIHGGGTNDQNVTVDVNPSSITVAGAREDVDSIQRILLRTIDLATVRDGDVLTYSIPLADELTNISGNTEATVTVTIAGLETKTVITNNISYIHEPEDWAVRMITQEIPVEIRGTPESLAELEGSNVRVVVDLDDLTNLSAGQYTLSARIYLDNVGSDAGVLGGESSYRVVIALSR